MACLVVLILSVFLGVCQAEEITAKAYMFSADNRTNLGALEFVQDLSSNEVKITGTLTGIFPEGKHGFHVHDIGDIGNECQNAKGHYNPEGKNHGGPSASVRHVGDLGNVRSDASGKVEVLITDSVIQLIGPHSIIGRAMVIHKDVDDLGLGNYSDSLTTGHAGARLGCGVIGITSEGYNPVGNSAGVKLLTTLSLIFMTAASLILRGSLNV